MTLCGDPTLKLNTGNFFYVDPVGICAGNSPCFTTIQTAIDSVGCGAAIKILAGEFDENITVNANPQINSNHRVILRGGWDSSFSNVVSTSQIHSLIIEAGTLHTYDIAMGNF
jgi:pectin methylesterase-like acyl-CoA thioesterase